MVAPVKAPLNPSNVPPLAVELVEGFEGFRANPYPDPGTGDKPVTQGFGSTEDANGQPFTMASPTLTRAAASALLDRDMSKAALYVSLHVTKALNVNQRSALISLVYNIGIEAFLLSTLLRDLNAGNWLAAANQFLVWNRSGGQVLAGLVTRRKVERKVFMAVVLPTVTKAA